MTTTVHEPKTQRNHHRTYAGTHRRVAPEILARRVAESILLHQADGHSRTLADYGIEEDSAMAALVQAELARLES